MIYNFEELSFQILGVMVFKHNDGRHRVAERPYAALSYRICGEGSFRIDGKNIDVIEGDVIFGPDGMSYEVEYSGSESIVIHLTGCNYREAEKMTFGDKKEIESRFWKLLMSWQELHSVNCAKSCVYDILACFESESVAEDTDPDVARCVQYFHETFTESETTVELLCGLTHLSHSTIRRKFKRYLGVTPKEYLTGLRMKKALDLLTRGEMSVKEAAYACGYGDEKYFSRVFSKTYGHPPVRFSSGLPV